MGFDTNTCHCGWTWASVAASCEPQATPEAVARRTVVRHSVYMQMHTHESSLIAVVSLNVVAPDDRVSLRVYLGDPYDPRRPRRPTAARRQPWEGQLTVRAMRYDVGVHGHTTRSDPTLGAGAYDAARAIVSATRVCLCTLVCL